ncbi:hypothetical protein JCM18901_1410 [Psychrobacter sp. JCM 18901]|uniref:hypothetical protein n=1 Tax=Psychrobacter sp. JCM 18901 TaxID=1298609 RepID=UPI0004326F1E|nr:hypothetical protein [Psychrobacter sp. JCM 18901]GAF55744.1 hypothetical protein JCM18901_1410 [Psychrobacter sp. JCM 18901]
MNSIKRYVRHKLINTFCTTNLASLSAFALSLAVLPVTVQASTSQTYVIHTYGGANLLPAVRQQLNSSADGGTVTTYQDKLVLRTTARNYQVVQQLLSQIDRQPQALTVAVRVGNSSSEQGNIHQSQVIITNRGIQGAGVISQRSSQQQSSNLYQVQTLSGSAASISTGTLYSLTQTYNTNNHSTYHRSASHDFKPQIVIQQQILLPTTQGIAVTPRLLPSGQVEIQLSQVEERLVQLNSPYNQMSSTNNTNSASNAIRGQRLNSTMIVPRGQWVTIGQISQNSSSSTSNGSRTINNNNSVPISLRVD